ncbi:PorT family protein [Hymenobacter sp. BT175]|uniref:outer membrane beta-barrel protein n=1 Tax=Hymenobacter translucens TaxID=2886507 RepID=UPI001D0EB14E|nr:outer membrane beta-barrel protein [Hymenobacter translucens]MCC2546672.1 PorT family protein [Hymenobacter translucens]
MQLPFTIPKLPLAAAIILIGSQSAYAQFQRNDFLVLTNGDTLRGEIRQLQHFEGEVDKKENQLRFRQKGGKFTMYPASQVSSYGEGQAVQQITRTIGGSVLFLTPLVKGPVSAYSGKNAQGATRYYLEVPDKAELVEIDPNAYRLQYHKNLGGCPTLDFAVDATYAHHRPYTYAGVTDVVTRYNACRYPNQPSEKAKLPSGWRFRPGAKLGLTRTTYTVPDAEFDNDPQRQSAQPITSVFVRATNRSPLGFQAELGFTQVKIDFEGKNIYTGGATYTLDRLTHVNYSNVQLGVLGNLFLYRGMISPFVNGGMVFGLRLNDNSTVEYVRSDRPTPESRPFPKFKGANAGLSAGGGFTVAIRKTSLISLEYRYLNIQDGFNNDAPLRQINRVDLGFSL